MGALDTLNTLSSPLTSAAAALPAKNDALINKQAGMTSDYLGRYTGAIAGQEKAADMYKRVGEQYGLPQLNQTAFNLQRAVANAPAVQRTAARGNEINQNQLDRMISGQLAKLSPAAQEATAQAQNAQGMVTQAMGFEQADQAKALLPYATEKDFLTDRLARETTLYTTANEAELNSLLQKMNAGVTLTEGEATRANQLAMAEMNYKLEKEKMAQQADQFKVTSANTRTSNLIDLMNSFNR